MKRPENNIHPLIVYLVEKKEKTIAGNKEFYSVLKYENGKIINFGGETFPFKEQYRNEINEETAISMLKTYYLDKCDTFNLKCPNSEQEWDNFLKDNFYI